MRLSVALVLSLLVFTSMSFNTSPDTKYNWDEHSDARDLYVTLSNEPEIIFVVYFFKNVEGKTDLAKANDSLKNKLMIELEKYDDVTIANVDMTPKPAAKADAGAAAPAAAAPAAEGSAPAPAQGQAPKAPEYTYETLARDNMGIDLKLLEQGPIVAVIKNGKF